MEIHKAEASDAGCWIDGHWGQYAIARLVEIAAEYGYSDAEIIDIATRKLATMGPSDAEEITLAEEEILSDAADEVESWLNGNVAPSGYYFAWFDGEFFLSPVLFDVVAEGLYDVESMPYSEAVDLLNETCDEWEGDGWTVERGWASSGNYSAARATKGSAERFIAIERAEEF